MIENINNFKKINDILFSEGMILGLYSLKNEYYFASFIKNNLGVVFYSITDEMVIKYFDSEVTLSQVYKETNDFFVSIKCQNESRVHLKEDFIELLQFGDKIYNQIDKTMRNDNAKRHFI